MGGLIRWNTGNLPPVWGTITLANVPGGQTTTQDISGFAFDPEGGTKTFSKISGPSFVSVSSAGIVSFAAAATQVGSYTAVFGVSDGANTTPSASTLVVVVKGTNRAPVWVAPGSPIPMVVPAVGQFATFNISTLCSDLDLDTLAFSIKPPLTLPTGITLDVSGLLKVADNAAIGSVGLSFRAWDGGAIGLGTSADSSTYTFTVSHAYSANQAPVWTAGVQTISITVGQHFNLNSICTDPDLPPQVLSYSAPAGSLGSLASLSSAGDLVGLAAGSVTVTFTADDGQP